MTIQNLLIISQTSKLPSARDRKNTDGLFRLQRHAVNWADRFRQNIGVHDKSFDHKDSTFRPTDRKSSGANGLRSTLRIGPS